MASAAQSTPFTTLMDSFALVLTNGLTDILDPSKIHEYWGEERPKYEGEQHVSFRLTDWAPELYSGAGRLASLTDVVFEVRIWTQLFSDLAGVGQAWFRNQGRGHWVVLFACLDCLDNNNIFDAYDIHGEPSGNRLTIEPLQQLPSKFAEQSVKEPSWGMSALLFQVALSKPLTIS